MLSRNSVDRITDRSDMISAVNHGRKASTQTNKQKFVFRGQFYTLGRLQHFFLVSKNLGALRNTSLQKKIV